MKYIKKLLPVNIYDIAEVESYFSMMAEKGLFIKKVGFFAHFQKDSPQKTVYRLEPVTKTQRAPSDEMIAYYEEEGWIYVCTISHAFRVFRSIIENPKELHTDPITQSYTFELLNKKLKFAYLASIIAAIWIIGMILFSIVLTPNPVLYAVKYGQTSFMVMICLAMFYSLSQIISSRNKINKLTKQLQSGVSLRHKRHYHTNYIPYAFNGLIMLFSLVTIFSSIYGMAADWDQNLMDYSGQVPAIRLTSIETSDKFEIEHSIAERSGKDFGGFISYSWSGIGTEIYEVSERGSVKDKKWNDDSGIYSPSISTEFYEIKFKFLSSRLMEDLIDDELEFYRYRPYEYHEILETDFDQAVIIKSEESQMFFGRIGGKVIYVRYYGYKDLSLFQADIFDSIQQF
ncbi:DUF2812 domain-containing protein [Fusibacter bizertensis]|uniref:DUF2812 domain-containing protein n=1 Tax=Fusibacter bizertensis TaxID=1488331 RepID=A0ABT6NFW5_9FIRM|nr:DUF2812 domain-containing protein [Fusibacter bizertensis]MDH8679306.1 DUF2812 domain-containing protein [Fusibacter bizertensis]